MPAPRGAGVPPPAHRPKAATESEPRTSQAGRWGGLIQGPRLERSLFICPYVIPVGMQGTRLVVEAVGGFHEISVYLSLCGPWISLYLSLCGPCVVVKASSVILIPVFGLEGSRIRLDAGKMPAPRGAGAPPAALRPKATTESEPRTSQAGRWGGLIQGPRLAVSIYLFLCGRHRQAGGAG